MSADRLEAAILIGAVAALRNRAAMLREKAAPGVTRLADRTPVVIVIASESPHSLRVADDFEAIANEIEVEVAL